MWANTNELEEGRISTDFSSTLEAQRTTFVALQLALPKVTKIVQFDKRMW